MLPGIMGIMAGVAGTFDVSYLSKDSIEDTNLSTFTFSSEGFGAADSAREIYVLVSFGAGATRTISSATIGGVSATIVTQTSASDGGGQALGTAILRAAVPTGTTGSIVINFNFSSVNCCIIGIVRVVNKTTDVDSDSHSGTDAASPATDSRSVNVNAQGAVLACWACSDEPFNVTWTNCTERYDGSTSGAFSANRIQYSGAVSSELVASTPLAVSASQASTGLAGVSISVASIA